MACSYLSVSIFWTLLSELWWASANHVALLLTLMPKFRLISVLLSVIPLITRVLRVLSITSPSPGLIFPMLSSRSVYICMIRESPTCLLSSESYSIFVALSIMVFFFIVAPLQSWLYILMLIGPLLPLTSTSGHSTNSIGWSRKTYKPRIYNTWCAQAPIALRYANLA